MKDRDAELRDELRAHLDMATKDRIERGQAPDEAAAAARRELGNVSQIQEATRDMWGRRWIERALQDARYALGVSVRNPGFAAVAMLSLALGIGANTALFELVDAVRLQSLPVADPSRLVEIRPVSMDGARGHFETWHDSVTYPIWNEIRERARGFSSVFAWGTDTYNLGTGGEIRPLHTMWASGGMFDALGLRPAAGRLLSPDDDRPGCVPRAVLSYAYWQRAFGGSPSAVGQTLTVGTHPVEVIGVAPRGFFGMEVGRGFDAAMPLCADAALSTDGVGRLASGTDWWVSVFGRLAPGTSIDAASAQLAAISPALFAATLPANYPPVSAPKYLKFTLAAFPGGGGLSQLRHDYEAPLWLLLGLAGLVLLIACANLANLLLARATARQREIAVRIGIGASRWRIVRQLLTESLMLALAGGAAGLLVARGLSRAFVTLLTTPSGGLVLPIGVDWRVLAFAGGLSLLTSVLFGVAPALNATRVSASAVMRASGRGATANRGSARIRRALVVAQVALSVVLLFGSLLFTRSLHKLATVDPGFSRDGVITAGFNFRDLSIDAARRPAYRADIIRRVRAIPGVEDAAITSVIPLSGSVSGNDVWPQGDRSRRFNTLRDAVGPGYFATLRIPIIAGRDFDERDAASSAPTAIVNEAFAAALAVGPSVVGARFTQEATPSQPEKTFEIVGVVRNSKYLDLKEQQDQDPIAYLADAQSGEARYLSAAIRSNLPAASVTAAVTRAMADLNPQISIAYSVLADDIDRTLLRERLLARLSGWFGALAAVLTLVGLYGLIAYTVTRRTNEIGVRMALGAGRGAIARLILREMGLLVGVGAAIGAAMAAGAGRSAATLLFGLRPWDPVSMAVALCALAAIAFAASYAPMRRAVRIEPVIALRQE